MRIEIESNIIKHCLQNVYFITGTSYAGKSTMVKLLAEKYDMIFCGENYHDTFAQGITTPEKQPNLCYFKTMKDWQEFINRTPDEYEKWIDGGAAEATEFEIVELLKLSATGKKIIVDTNISTDILHEISDYEHVAIMLSPMSMSVEKFFDREDEDKQFILKQIEAAEKPKKTMENYKACIARINSQERYNEYANSGFMTIVREDTEIDTRQEVLMQLEKHFSLS